ncbi:uncharacterized protein LOC131289801 [Anopheles ziemanni]|uniref:uncharacterized protein LOC131260807 n=1 Tax=Anopheles coustani TaxID=139045 RepID=UPI00265ABF3A|nr:uncharacterized protein LOC131260807 [Anopheles coustani]XP_058175097.1 uncharacterized protein LOC131289801 [Anopheles ziemanni]
MTPMGRRFTRGSIFTDCPIEPSCTNGHGSAGKRKSTVLTATTSSRVTSRTMPGTTMAVRKQTVTTRTVLLCCWCLLLATTACSGLPITSKPLDNNPDHLTWEAAWLSEDSRGAPPQPLGGKSKKITPKSIFITPYLNSYNTSACPPDYKVDYNGKCIQVVSINPADILVTKLQSLFSQNGDTGSPGGAGEDDYDYGDYDSTGPFQVNLPLSIDLAPEPPQPPQGGPKLTYQDIPGPSFYDSAMVDVATVEQDNGKITTVSVTGNGPDKPFPATTVANGNGKDTTTSTTTTTSSTSSSSSSNADQTVAESHTDISFLAFETLPNGTLAGQIELDGNNRTVVQSIFVSSTTTTERPTTTTGSSTTESTATSVELDGYSGTTTDRNGATVDTDAAVASSSLSSSTPAQMTTTTVQGESTTVTERQDETYPTDIVNAGTTGGVTTTTTITTSATEQDDELDDLKLELVDEMLLMDNNRSTIGSSTLPDTSTTDVSEMMMDLDTLPTAETQPSDEQPTLANFQKESSTTERPNTVAPTKSPVVQIVTPLRNSWLEYGNRGGESLAPAPHLVPASHIIQQDRTTRATPETTTVPYERPPTINVTNVVQTPSTEPSVSTRDRDVLQVRPLVTTPASNNYLEQLRKINEIVAEKRRQQQQQEQQLAGTGHGGDGSRIRFPSRDEEQLTGAASNNNYQRTSNASPNVLGGGGGVRFPGSATNRLTPNRLPDIFPKKSPDSTTQRPAFWWLPSGWEVDQTGNKPMLLRFWSRMPLVRDASQTHDGSATANENDLSAGTGTTNNNNRWRSSTGFQSGNSLPAAAAAATTGSGTSRAASSHPVASARGNSKSPSENFYKEVSAQEVYKVMNARQLHHHQKR